MSAIKKWMLDNQRDNEMTQEEIMRYYEWMNENWNEKEALDFFAPLMEEKDG